MYTNYPGTFKNNHMLYNIYMISRQCILFFSIEVFIFEPNREKKVMITAQSGIKNYQYLRKFKKSKPNRCLQENSKFVFKYSEIQLIKNGK